MRKIKEQVDFDRFDFFEAMDYLINVADDEETFLKYIENNSIADNQELQYYLFNYIDPAVKKLKSLYKSIHRY